MPTLRAATLDDMPRLQEIVRTVWAIGSDFTLEEKYGSVGDERWDRWLVPKVMSRLYDELGSILVAEVDGEIVVREVYAAGSDRLLLGKQGTQGRVPPEAILGRVVRIVQIRDLER